MDKPIADHKEYLKNQVLYNLKISLNKPFHVPSSNPIPEFKHILRIYSKFLHFTRISRQSYKMLSNSRWLNIIITNCFINKQNLINIHKRFNTSLEYFISHSFADNALVIVS